MFGTFAFGTGTEGTGFPHHPHIDDVLSLTAHDIHADHELDLIEAAGFQDYRMIIPWHRIQRVEDGPFDWSDIAPIVERLRRLIEAGTLTRVSFDLCHHVSYPKWMTEGFLDCRFVPAFVRFARAFAEAHPWVEWYTLINEPLTNALFCGMNGIWHPYRKSAPAFVRAIVQSGRAISLGAQAVLAVNPNAKFLHTDSCEFHQADPNDAGSVELARFARERALLVDDLLSGRVTQDHPLHWYLHDNGFTVSDQLWFLAHPAPITIRGLDDYYLHQHYYLDNGRVDLVAGVPSHLEQVGQWYAEHLNLPIALTETNIRGYCSDRMFWFLYQLRQARKLAKKTDFRAFYWYPFSDSMAWGSLVQDPYGHDPTGIVIIDPDTLHRHRNPFYDLVSLIARGIVTDIESIPLPRPKPPVDAHLWAYIRALDKEGVPWIEDDPLHVPHGRLAEYKVLDWVTHHLI